MLIITFSKLQSRVGIFSHYYIPLSSAFGIPLPVCPIVDPSLLSGVLNMNYYTLRFIRVTTKYRTGKQWPNSSSFLLSSETLFRIADSGSYAVSEAFSEPALSHETRLFAQYH